jgi:hypothetical protein
MKALEDDSDFRLKTLKENDMDNKDIEEIKTRLKVRKHHRHNITCFESGSAWIHVDSGLPDLDPGGQKLPTKKKKLKKEKKFHVLKCWMFSFES